MHTCCPCKDTSKTHNGNIQKKEEHRRNQMGSFMNIHLVLCLISACLLQASEALTNEEFSQECLKWHNHFRAEHNSPQLTLSPGLTDQARLSAKVVAKMRNVFYASAQVQRFGYNLAYFEKDRPLVLADVENVVKSWYHGSVNYSYKEGKAKDPGAESVYDFTQVVWAKTMELGCQYALDSKGMAYVVAYYSPKGNAPDEFIANVHTPIVV